MFRWNFVIKIICIIIPVILLSSCAKPGLKPVMYSNDEQKADARLEQIIETVNNEDTDALKAMFSETALGEAENLDEGIEYLFNFVDGKIVSYNSRAGTVNGHFNHGKREKEVRYEYTVRTDNAEYKLFFYEITENTEHPEEIGVYMIQIYTPEERSDVFDWGNNKKGAGIYRK